MPRLSFRSRVSLTLLLLAIPSAVGMLGWASSVLTNNPAKAAQVVVNPLRKSGRDLLITLDTTKLSTVEKTALQNHFDRLSQALILSRRGEVYKSRLTTGLAIFLAVIGTMLFFATFAR